MEPAGKTLWPRGASAVATAGACALALLYFQVDRVLSAHLSSQRLCFWGMQSSSEEVVKAGRRVGATGKRPSKVALALLPLRLALGSGKLFVNGTV